MKYLKSYKVFESLELEQELNDLFLNLRDNGFNVFISHVNNTSDAVGPSRIDNISIHLLGYTGGLRPNGIRKKMFQVFKYGDVDDDVEMITNYLESEGYTCSVVVKCYGEEEKILYPTKFDSDFECISYIKIKVK